jgi:hypothetical protein
LAEAVVVDPDLLVSSASGVDRADARDASSADADGSLGDSVSDSSVTGVL